jgi:nucleoside-diphosphate-sugar epimerase
MKSVLVLGGTGFVSGAIAMHLIEEGFKVDIFTKGDKKPTFSGFRKHIIGDRNSFDSLKQIANESYDFVFDIIAQTKQEIEKLILSIDTSKLKKFVFCSSAAVYLPSDKELKEEDPKGFNSFWQSYGLNKLEAENFLFDLYEKKDFPTIIFRPVYIYGKGNNLYRENYIFERIEQNLLIPVPESNARIHFIHIDDLVKVFSSVLSSNVIGQAFNLSFPEPVTFIEWINAIEKVMHKKARIKIIPKEKLNKLNINAREFFPFRDVSLLLNTEKLKTYDLFYPKISLDKGLTLTYNEFLKSKPKLFDPRMNKIEDVLSEENEN